MLNLSVVRKEINKMHEFKQGKTLEHLEQETERKDLMRCVKPLLSLFRNNGGSEMVNEG